jgi:hypothetical protein
MKRTVLALVAVAVLLAGSREATAQSSRGGDVGLGIVLGDPTGFSAMFRLGGAGALDLAIGIDVFGDDDFYVHLEYVHFLTDLSRGGTAGLIPYVGIGGFFVTDVDFIGARAPFGLAIEFNRAPIQIFGELALFLLLDPDVDLDVGGAIGFRYFF